MPEASRAVLFAVRAPTAAPALGGEVLTPAWGAKPAERPTEAELWKERPIRTKRVGVTRCESPAAFAHKRVGTLGACAPGRQSRFPSRFLRRGAALVPAPAWRPPA